MPSSMCESPSDEPDGYLPSLGISDLLEDFPDPDEMCRLCMVVNSSDSKQDMVDISATNPYSASPIPHLFAVGLGIDVNETSSAGMPQKVCTNCLCQLHSFTVFKKRSLEVDAKLRHIVSRKQQLAQAQALYGPVFFDSSQNSGCTTLDSLYFETIDHDGKSDFCSSTVRKTPCEVEDLFTMGDSKASPCVEIGEIEATLRETNVVGSNFEEKSSSNKMTAEDSLVSSSLDVSNSSHVGGVCNEIVNRTFGSQQKASSHKQIQTTLEGDFFSSGIVGEIVISDAGPENQVSDPTCQPEIGTGVDVRASDIFSDRVSGDEEEGTENSQNINESWAPHTISCRKKSFKRDPLVMPDVHVVEEEDGSKHFTFGCPLCRLNFESRLLFRKHMPTHLRQKGGTCKHCDKWFSTQNALVRHERVHSGVKPFLCLLCERSFSQKEILQRHILTHSDKKPFPCQHCDKSYTQKEGLASHVKNYHPTVLEIIQHQCPLCDKAFCHPSGLSRHMAIHSGKQYVCSVCNRNFNDSSSLRRHSNKKHPSKNVGDVQK